MGKLRKYKIQILNDHEKNNESLQCEKVNKPSNFCCATLGHWTCNQAFLITGNECFRWLWIHFNPLFCVELF